MLKTKLEMIKLLLLRGNISQRAIARTVNMDRKTVKRIASSMDLDEVIEIILEQEAKRCPGCGGLVYLPCLLCKARRVHDDRLKRNK